MNNELTVLKQGEELWVQDLVNEEAKINEETCYSCIETTLF